MKHPSCSPNIDEIGLALPEFVAPHALAQDFLFLKDVAALDRAVLFAIYADRALAFSPESIQGVAEERWPEARLVPDPTVQLLAGDWPVERLWRRRATPEDRPLPALRPSPRWLLVHRTDVELHVTSLPEPQWRALSRFQAGETLAAVCDALEKDAGPDDVQSWFGAWVRDGIVKRIVFPSL